MIPLNLPSFEYKIKKEEEKVFIFDVIRKKFLVLTPEEWVRQHILHYMISFLKYPKALITIETGLTYNQLSKRFDILVYDRNGAPWLMVECKSPGQPIDQKTLNQVATYNTQFNATYLVLTNGLKHICCKVDHINRQVNPINDFPAFPL